MLGQILQVPLTHLDRAWTNQRIINTLTQAHNCTHLSLSTRWTARKLPLLGLTLLGHILRATNSDPMREVLLQSQTNISRHEHLRRVGKPRAHWQQPRANNHVRRKGAAQGCSLPNKKMRAAKGQSQQESSVAALSLNLSSKVSLNRECKRPSCPQKILCFFSVYLHSQKLWPAALVMAWTRQGSDQLYLEHRMAKEGASDHEVSSDSDPGG